MNVNINLTISLGYGDDDIQYKGNDPKVATSLLTIAENKTSEGEE